MIAVGSSYGWWTVLSVLSGGSPSKIQYLCQCRCGREASVRADHLANGASTRCRACGPTTHGQHRAPEYRVWEGMIGRCENPNNRAYDNYGGRGIVVCERWRASYEAFISDMGPRPSPHHSIERKDNDGPYAPENCVWETKRAQTRNTRRNHFVTLNGERRTIADLAEASGLDRKTIKARLAAGWSPERAISEPRAPGRGNPLSSRPEFRIIDLEDGTASECTLAEFLIANGDCDDLCDEVRALAVGASTKVGGGAAPAFEIARLS